MKTEIDCGLGVTINPVVENRMGLDYSDYEIKKCDGERMKITNHELMIYTNDDYRENVLKCQAGRDSVKQFFTAQVTFRY